MIREGLVDEQCFESANQASLAVFLPTTQDKNDSEREVTIRENLLILALPDLVCWIYSDSALII